MEYASVEAIDGKSPIMLKAIPKTSIIVKLRRNSCLYPSFANYGIRYTFFNSLTIDSPKAAASSSLARP